MTKFKCPYCNSIYVSPYCFSCGKDIPPSAMFDDSPAGRKKPNVIVPQKTYYDINIGGYFFADPKRRVFKVSGQKNECSYSDLIDFELCENGETVMKGGVGRAIVGGALFGAVGAVVGANTRKSRQMVNSLYIRITTRTVGMLRICFFMSPTPTDSFTYRVDKDLAEKIITQLEIISDSNKRDSGINNDSSELSVADELLKLKQLMDMGVLTKEEFEEQKKKLLNK